MMDEQACERRKLPCDRPNERDNNGEGLMEGLKNLDIWWRKGAYAMLYEKKNATREKDDVERDNYNYEEDKDDIEV